MTVSKGREGWHDKVYKGFHHEMPEVAVVLHSTVWHAETTVKVKVGRDSKRGRQTTACDHGANNP